MSTTTTTTTTTRSGPVAAGASGGRAAGVATWVRACRVADVVPDRGVAALVGSRQVAIFVLSSPAPAGRPAERRAGAGVEVFAVANRDPYSGANVMARGLVGSAGDRPTVASPVYKQRFALEDGACLDGEEHLPTWPVRVVDGWVEVGDPGGPAESSGSGRPHLPGRDVETRP